MPDPRFLRSKVLRNILWEAADGKCPICGRPLPARWHADHVKPWRVDPKTDHRDMQALCPGCNLRKGDSMDSRAGMLEKARRLIARIAEHDCLVRRHQLEMLMIAERVIAGTHDWKAPGVIIADVVPGGGKSYLAVILACILIESGYVGQALWLVPRALLGSQGEDDFNEKDFRLPDGTPFNLFNPTGILARHLPDIGYPFLREVFEGMCHKVAIASYQLMAARPGSFMTFVREKPTLVIADESQMMYSGPEPSMCGKSWGQVFENVHAAARSAGGITLSMSGYPFRHDGGQLPLIPYVLGDPCRGQDPRRMYPMADIVYDLAAAQAEKALILFDFDLYHGNVSFSWDGKLLDFDLEHNDPEYEGKKLKTYLGERGVWEFILNDMVDSWRNYNAAMHGYDSRILVIAYSKHMAREHQIHLQDRCGIKTLLAIEDEPRVHKAINAFRKRETDHKAMVTVGMAYIGLSVKDFSHMGYLHTNRSLPYCVQAFHRITRFDDRAPVGWEYQFARFFVPTDPKMLAIKKAILAMQHPGLLANKPPGPPPPPPGPSRIYLPVSAEVTGREFETQDRPIEDHRGVDSMLRAVPKLSFLLRADVELAAKVARGEASKEAATPPPRGDTGFGSGEEEVLSKQVENTARRIDIILGERHGEKKFPKGWFNGHLVRRFGKSRGSMGPFELRKVREYADRYLRRLEAGIDPDGPDEDVA
jgi:superfamily II DNA or RNA helicase